MEFTRLPGETRTQAKATLHVVLALDHSPVTLQQPSPVDAGIASALEGLEVSPKRLLAAGSGVSCSKSKGERPRKSYVGIV